MSPDPPKLTASHSREGSAETGFLDRCIVLDGEEYWYTVHVPREYSGNAKWPVILSLHGSGLDGADGSRHTNSGLAAAIREHRAWWPALVVFPQARFGDPWASGRNPVAMAALEATEREFHTDGSRVYLTGFSTGGAGSWYLAYHHPQRFAALLVIAGFVGELRGIPSFIPTGDPHDEVARALGDTPVWILHGDRDANVSVRESRQMADALRRAGGSVRYTELPNREHDIRGTVYRDRSVIEWLLSHRLPADTSRR